MAANADASRILRLSTTTTRSVWTKAVAALAAAGLLTACSTISEEDFVTSVQPRSSKYAALVVDARTGRTLYEADSNATRYPASLTKMMTLYMLFEALDSGSLSRADTIECSDFARSRPPSKLGMKRGESITVETAIQALATKSANDVAVAVAERLGGSEAQFASMMTAKARQLGMNSTTFRNASGLPDDGQRTTARDMAVLGMALKNHFPQYYGYFARQSFAFRGRTVNGHNDLIGRVKGVDGIKTGYIRSSGYNIVTSVSRGGKRLFIVVMGGDSASSRNAHVVELIDKYMPSSTANAGVASMLWDN
jgi:D-alanyl-D-alanine carboxypeptidase